jgi:hypothetical protein
LNIYYEAEHADSPVIVANPNEVRALFAAVRDKYSAGSAVLLTIVLSDDPWGPELSGGINGDKGVLRYAAESYPEGMYSKSATPTNPEPVIYYYVTADTEFPANAEVSSPTVETAVTEYLTTAGKRPTAVEWQTA